MLRSGLFWRNLLAILAVGLGSVLTVGLVARSVFTRALIDYAQTLPQPRGMGPMGSRQGAVLGVAEQAFIDSVDRGVLLGVVVAAAIAALAAFVLARALATPLHRLEDAASVLASGDLAHRVHVGGPHEVVALGESFNLMADALQDAEALRRRLVADVAHELRNPLAAARAQAEGMADGIIPVGTERLRSLLRDLEQLSRLVDDLQELALAESGRLTYHMVALDVADLVTLEAERFATAVSRDIEVNRPSDPDGSPVIADEGRIAQVLRNLLSNSVRHAPSGTIRVAVQIRTDDVEVRVIDTGGGISADDLPHVFERFYRADSARAGDTGGAGLGLAISKHIIEDHGGEVFALSVPGIETSVGFRLPLAAEQTTRTRE